MPFLKGAMPIRRTYYYLNKGELIFRNSVKILICGFNVQQKGHDGMRDFAFWEFCQIQWKNPNIQLLKLNKMSPYPFLMAIFNNGEDVVLDCDHYNRQQIHDLCLKFFCKSPELLAKQRAKESEPVAKFGTEFDRHCICEVEGQWPCTSVINAPKYLTGTWRWNRNCPKK